MGDHCLLVSLEGCFLISCGWCSCWSVESACDKKQPFFSPSTWGLFQSLQNKTSVLKCDLWPKLFEHCLIRQVKVLFLLLQCGSEAIPKPKSTPNTGLHASEWKTPRLIRHSKVYFFILSYYFSVNRLQCFAWGGVQASRAAEPSETIIGVSGCGYTHTHKSPLQTQYSLSCSYESRCSVLIFISSQ